MRAYVAFLYVSKNTGLPNVASGEYEFVREKPTYNDILEMEENIQKTLGSGHVVILNIIPVSESED